MTYYISKEHPHKYLTSVIYDIQKEKKYKNIIVFVDDIKRININNFSFGLNHVLILEDSIFNREKLKYMNSINWSEILKDTYYHKNISLSEYNFCDYTDHKNKYISVFYYFDTEKITRIKNFLRENINKSADIVCSIELKELIKVELPDANYNIVNLKKYINKERNIYD